MIAAIGFWGRVYKGNNFIFAAKGYALFDI
jgi:hypothetical protein